VVLKDGGSWEFLSKVRGRMPGDVFEEYLSETNWAEQMEEGQEFLV
jgi:hypothetical protein